MSTQSANLHEVKEAAAFEARRKELWKSAYGDPSAAALARRKKQQLTPEQRQQQMKGLSKAFVSSGAGWSKVDPVLVVDEDENDDDSSSSSDGDNGPQIEAQTLATGRKNIDNKDGSNNIDDDDDDDEDVVALMRSQMERLQQKQNVSQAPLKPQLPPGPISIPSRTPTESSIVQASLQSGRQDPLWFSPKTVGNSEEDTSEEFQKSEIQALHRLLQMADEKGLEVAWRWARDEVVKSGVPNVWTEPRKSTLSDLGRQKALSLPQPLRLINGSNAKAVDVERQEYLHFREAAQYVPFEYTSRSASDAALFVVRRPYKLESRTDLFEGLSEQSHPLYSRKAHVSAISTLEVAVIVKPDRPILLLYGGGEVRYRKRTNAKLQTHSNLSVSQPTLLGNYEHIDEKASLKCHSLDHLYQEALLVREHYASTMTSTALCFANRSPIENTKLSQVSSEDAAVDTADLMTKDEVTNRAVSAPTPAVSATQHTRLYQSFRHFTWWVLVRLPVLTLKTSVLAVLGLSAISLFYLVEEQHLFGLGLSSASNVGTARDIFSGPKVP